MKRTSTIMVSHLNGIQRSPLRIAITVDPEIPVPPLLYGGIERIVDMLVRELQKRGHEVHLFANPESSINTNLAPYPAISSVSPKDTLENMLYIQQYLRQNGAFDIIHSFARLAYLLPWLPRSIPKIQSYQREISPRSVILGTSLSRGTLHFTSCSTANAATVSRYGQWTTIYNGVDINKYRFESHVTEDAPLVFLGRVERIKGAHTAIKVAKATNRRLIAAGNHASSGHEAKYFEEEFFPQVDGDQIQYIGPVNDEQKNELLGMAAALLFPIDWEEPFGIVMIEALACGTPVIAFRRGSVPEVIKHQKTGFICDNLDEMISAVNNLKIIQREDCREDVNLHFSHSVIADTYESLYYSMLK